jgi:hypothetical protein
MKFATRFVLSIPFVLSAAGCGQVGFTGGNNIKQSNNPTDPTKCVPGTATKILPVKFLFIVDESGSNVSGPYEHPNEPTDPQKTFRYGVINDFFQKHGSQQNISWGFIGFNDTSAHAFINSGDDQHPIFSNASAMSSALQVFLNTPDSGSTPYRAALQMAHDLIQQDLASSAIAFQYRIAFLTDGYPTDYCSDQSKSCNVPIGKIVADVQNVISLSQKSIQLSTVYYGLPDPDAAARLQAMAQTGGGQFVDTNVTKVINLDDVINVPVTCP